MSCLTCYRSVSVGVVRSGKKLYGFREGSALGLGGGRVLRSDLGQSAPTVVPGADHSSVAAVRRNNPGSFKFLVGARHRVRGHVEYPCQVPDRRKLRSDRKGP